jgi:hypothetical protein
MLESFLQEFGITPCCRETLNKPTAPVFEGNNYV